MSDDDPAGQAGPNDGPGVASPTAEAVDPTPGERLRRTAGAARFRRWFGVHFLAAILVFAAGGVAGGLLVGAMDVESLQQFAGDGSILPDRITVLSLTVNNLIALGVDALGLVTVGLASVLMLFLNGLLVGVVVALAVGQGSSPLLLAALIVPHGVLELGAFFLVGGMSFRLYHRLARYLVGADDRPITKVELFEMAVLLGVAVLSIPVAAAVEVYVTPAVAELLTGQEVSF